MSNFDHYNKTSKSSYNDADIPCRISFRYEAYQPATITAIKTNHAGEIASIEVKVLETVFKILWNVNRPKRDDIAIIVDEQIFGENI